MFLCDQWRDYEVLDTGDGEKPVSYTHLCLRHRFPNESTSIIRKAQRLSSAKGVFFFVSLPRKHLSAYFRPAGPK